MNNRLKNVAIAPMMMPARLIDRSFCPFLIAMMPVMTAGMPVSRPKPVKDTIPSTRDAIAKPLVPVSGAFTAFAAGAGVL